jgi:hypothetical protein
VSEGANRAPSGVGTRRIAPGATPVGDARSRLLPASIPFRYFGAAVTLHLAAWLALAADAAALPRFAGGIGWTLAGVHLFTLGVLAMTAIGASVQLLPVATRRPVGGARAPALLWWLYSVGVALVAGGMGLGETSLLVAGAASTVVALAVYALLLARNLSGAGAMPAVVVHGWIAVVSLVVTLVSATSLVLAYIGVAVLDRTTAVSLHVAFAVYGFMGLLALGFAYILVPMFALSAAPATRPSLVSAALAAFALALGALAAFGVAPPLLRCAALGAGGTALAIHLWLMTKALSTGLRRDLGRPFRLVRTGWGLMAASLLAGFAVVLDAPFTAAPALFGLAAVGGLLTFVLGVLERIVPFLGSMHATPRSGKRLPPTPSALTAAGPLAVHEACHFAALALLALAIVADSAIAARAGALVGAAGAVAFAAFFIVALHRMRASAPLEGAGAAPTP